MMPRQIPPAGTSAELSDYLFRQAKATDSSILEVNGISIREELPDRPRLGKLYFIKGDGLYYDVEGIWYKISATAI